MAKAFPQSRGRVPDGSKKPLKVFFAVLAVILFFSGALLSVPHILSWTSDYSEQAFPAGSGQFPVTVDPSHKIILENEQVNAFLADKHLLFGAAVSDAFAGISDWFASIADAPWYQGLASVSGRIVVVKPGMRKEEAASAFGKALGWKGKQEKEFLSPVGSSSLPLAEGSFFPGTYVVGTDTTPAEAQALVNQRFRDEVLAHYGTSTAEKVPLGEALTIASLIQRETITNDGMRLLSGIIWNRIFAGMNRQVDATLQYAKANKSASGSWWPDVVPKDKYIKSPFNTYRNGGLPPAPIANPSVAAILAALNPVATPCLFYFNDKTGAFHCSATYAEHVKLLSKYYSH